jgi:hypothetical protein
VAKYRRFKTSEQLMEQGRPNFHPQRVFPRYASVVRASSRLPVGISLTQRALGKFILDPFVSFSENPRPEDLQRTKIGICGFPRTGTTFLLKAVDIYIGRPGSGWKNHDPYTIRDFNAVSVPAIVTLRDPGDACISWAIYHGDAPSVSGLNHRLSLFIAWHRVMLREARRSPVVFAEFIDFTRSPLTLLSQLCPSGQASPRRDEVMKAVQQDNALDSRNERMANMPSPRRDALKQEYLSLLEQRSVMRNLKTAKEILNALRASRP